MRAGRALAGYFYLGIKIILMYTMSQKEVKKISLKDIGVNVKFLGDRNG